MNLDAHPIQETWYDEVRAGRCHIVTFAEIGLSSYSAYCELGYAIPRDEQVVHAERVNNSKETGTLYPKANITILPRLLFREVAPATEELRVAIRDAFVAERDYVRSGLMILEFSCSDVPAEQVTGICRELCAGEFIGVPGTAVLRLDSPEHRAPHDDGRDDLPARGEQE
ncbi:MAG: hypothetical protein K8T26_19720 [Lentisphaerae bacterium]|nr:hypothetical protein [Lentisphaerota bacterium]